MSHRLVLDELRVAGAMRGPCSFKPPRSVASGRATFAAPSAHGVRPGRPQGHRRSAAAAAGRLRPDPGRIQLKVRRTSRADRQAVKRIEGCRRSTAAGNRLDVRRPGMLARCCRSAPAREPREHRRHRRARRRGVIRSSGRQRRIAVVARRPRAARDADALVIEWQAHRGPVPTRNACERLHKALAHGGILDRPQRRPTSPPPAKRLRQALGSLYRSSLPVARGDGTAQLRRATAAPTDAMSGPRTQMQSPVERSGKRCRFTSREKCSSTTTLLGGGFGRRASASATSCVKRVNSRELKAPVQIVWTREDDMNGGWYPAAVTNRRAAHPSAPMANRLPASHGGRAIDHGRIHHAKHRSRHGLRSFIGRGRRRNALCVPNVRVTCTRPPAPVRSVVAFGRAFEYGIRSRRLHRRMRGAAGIDPIEYRARWLGNEHPRHRAVLAPYWRGIRWVSCCRAGRARGIAHPRIVRQRRSERSSKCPCRRVCRRVHRASVGTGVASSSLLRGRLMPSDRIVIRPITVVGGQYAITLIAHRTGGLCG